MRKLKVFLAQITGVLIALQILFMALYIADLKPWHNVEDVTLTVQHSNLGAVKDHLKLTKIDDGYELDIMLPTGRKVINILEHQKDGLKITQDPQTTEKSYKEYDFITTANGTTSDLKINSGEFWHLDSVDLGYSLSALLANPPYNLSIRFFNRKELKSFYINVNLVHLLGTYKPRKALLGIQDVWVNQDFEHPQTLRITIKTGKGTSQGLVQFADNGEKFRYDAISRKHSPLIFDASQSRQGDIPIFKVFNYNEYYIDSIYTDADTPKHVTLRLIHIMDKKNKREIIIKHR